MKAAALDLLLQNTLDDDARTKRDVLDFYPTPADAVSVFNDWLAGQPSAPAPDAAFLDPAAGEGHIIRAMRSMSGFTSSKFDCWGESFWHAIEINVGRASVLDLYAENVIVGDALSVDWPSAHVVANPPFSLLDEFWRLASDHRDRFRVWCAVFTPVAWWNAEKRASHTRPDFILSLGWRPVFRAQSGPAHKGSQDFCWSVLSPRPATSTTWMRVERPTRESAQLQLRGDRP